MNDKKGFTTTILHSDRLLKPEFGACVSDDSVKRRNLAECLREFGMNMFDRKILCKGQKGSVITFCEIKFLFLFVSLSK